MFQTRAFLCAIFFPLALSSCGGGSGPTAPTGSAIPLPALTPTVVPTTSAVVRVACVGDSITYGIGVPNSATDTYPATLGRFLGNSYEVKNFGVNSATVLQTGYLPYQKQPAFTQALKFKPNVLTVALGTNDSGRPFDVSSQANFVKDYKAIIGAFKKVNPEVKVYVCLPPVMQFENEPQNVILEKDVMPAIEQVARDSGAQIVDLHTPFRGQWPELYFDKIHPNVAGNNVIAAQVYRAFTGTEPPASG